MTLGDMQFLKELGIVPCAIEGSSPRPLPPPLPTEAPSPELTEEDARWLQNLGVTWDEDPEPVFVPPMTLKEYLLRYPNGIRQAVEVVAKEMGFTLTSDGLDGLATEVVRTFLDFAVDLEDIVAHFQFDQQVPIGVCLSVRFHSYIKVRVAALTPVILNQDPPDDKNC